jgi:hypothetical protein
VHNPLHAFCKQDEASTLDILLDIKKPYPLISRHADKRQQPVVVMFSRRIFLWNYAVGLNHIKRRFVYGEFNNMGR